MKTTGAEWKRFYTDESIWAEGVWHEDEQIEINGKPRDDEGSLDDVSDSDIILLMGGVLVTESANTYPSLETVFKKWRKSQSITTFAVEVDLQQGERF